jgi:tRNA threonylcarbamoyladenosine biosynthesis protein TsaE
MSADFTLDLPDEAATLALGQWLAPAMQANTTIYLQGDLGAGKTTLVRGLLRALGFNGKVKSPTYALLETYPIQLANRIEVQFCHFDLYRFNDEEEWESSGFRDYFNARSVCLIEWPDKAKNCLNRPDLEIIFEVKMLGENLGRRARIVAHTPLGKQCLQGIPSRL